MNSRNNEVSLVAGLRRRLLYAVAFLLIRTVTAVAQSSTAALEGTVVDFTGAALPDATVTLENIATAAKRQTQSGRDGMFAFTALPPDRYLLRASLPGFRSVEVPNLDLNVNDRIALRLELALAPLGEDVVVVADMHRVSKSASVGTAIDRQFVTNLPLSGRSLHSLLEMAPGVVVTSVPNTSQGGQFSINGQRANANYFTVDGVSANVGIVTASSPSVSPGQSGSGQLPAMNALGGTNGLVAVDALQEFRIQTSTYAPEFGRVPGGQISMVTRSGTNEFHGSAFDYERHEALDATDWFTNTQGQPKAKLRQHNFGGVLGGPIRRNRTFFFGSYEGLRLEQPRTVTVPVPSLGTRRMAIAELQPYMNAFPIPNGNDVGGGMAQFLASYSDPSRFDSTSVRIDHALSGRLTLFGRGNHAPSYASTRAAAPSVIITSNQNNTGVTLGSTWLLSGRFVHEMRLNYSSNYAPYVQSLDDFGGATPPPRTIFSEGHGPENAAFLFTLTGQTSWGWGIGTAFQQRQFNLVDSFTFTSGSHEWKAGLDFRRIHPLLSKGSAGLEALGFSISGLSSGQAGFYQTIVPAPGRRAVAFDNLSLYIQDNWRTTSRFTLTYGVRWEFVPPPHATNGDEAISLNRFDDLYGGQVGVAPRGTALWDTRYDNFGPRIGGSYTVFDKPGAELVVKGGFGTFHDLGYGQVISGYVGYPFVANKTISSPMFPLSREVLEPARPGVTPPQEIWVTDRANELPFTYQWNVSAERAVGAYQTLTVSYVGAEGRKLSKVDRYRINLIDWPNMLTNVMVNLNRGYSDYRALQLQFRRRMHRGFQALTSYTYGRSRDTASSENASTIPLERVPTERDYGYSSFDIRHVLTSAVSYELPDLSARTVVNAMARDWAFDLIVRARSGSPINVFASVAFPPNSELVRPNVVPGQAFWINDPAVPSGRKLNRQAFTLPPPNTQGDLMRGVVRGFSSTQVDLAIRRDFELRNFVRVQLRFEMFNILNTPQFSNPTGNLSNSLFGVATQTLNRGVGGLSPLYQMGGPRSTQIAAKLLF